jgi:hypothetical protein
LDGAAPLACAFVRPKGVKLPKGMVEIKTPHQVFHEIAETLLKAEPARAGATIAGIVKKLDNELLKGVRALRRLEKNTRNI